MHAKTKQKTVGILLLLGAALCFALMNLFVSKAGDLPVMQKVFFRNCITVAVVLIVLLFHKENFKVKQKSSLVWLFLRAAVGYLGVILNFYAIDHIGSISDASVLNKLSPFFAILFSIFLLKEKPRVLEIVFVVIAFAGALFVVKPTFSAQVLPALAGFASGMCAGFAYTCVRILGMRGESGNLTVFVFAVFSTVVTLPFAIIWWQPVTAMQLVWLLLAGAAATGGQFFITAAYRHAPAKEIAVFDYSQVLFAAVLGALFLSQIPDVWSIIGYIVIIGAAVGRWIYGIKCPAPLPARAAQRDKAVKILPDEAPKDENCKDDES